MKDQLKEQLKDFFVYLLPAFLINRSWRAKLISRYVFADFDGQYRWISHFKDDALRRWLWDVLDHCDDFYCLPRTGETK